MKVSHAVLASLVLSVSALAQKTLPPDAGIDPIARLLDQLPPVGKEHRFDRETRSWIPHPAVEALTRLLRDPNAAARVEDDLWRRLLIDREVVRWRPRWPAGVPFAISMSAPTWLGLVEVQMRPRLEQLAEAHCGTLTAESCGNAAFWRRESESYQELGTLAPGAHRLEFDVVVRRPWGEPNVWGFSRDDRGPVTLWRGPLTLHTEIVDTLERAIPGVRDAPTNEAVRSSVGLAFSVWGEEERNTAIFVLDPAVRDHALLAELALSIELDVLRDGEVVETASLFATGIDPLALSISVEETPRAIAFCGLDEPPGELLENTLERRRWSFRLRGTNRNVLPSWNASRYWAGVVELSFDEARARELERAGPSGREPWVWMPSFR